MAAALKWNLLSIFLWHPPFSIKLLLFCGTHLAVANTSHFHSSLYIKINVCFSDIASYFQWHPLSSGSCFPVTGVFQWQPLSSGSRFLFFCGTHRSIANTTHFHPSLYIQIIVCFAEALYSKQFSVAPTFSDIDCYLLEVFNFTIL